MFWIFFFMFCPFFLLLFCHNRTILVLSCFVFKFCLNLWVLALFVFCPSLRFWVIFQLFFLLWLVSYFNVCGWPGSSCELSPNLSFWVVSFVRFWVLEFCQDLSIFVLIWVYVFCHYLRCYFLSKFEFLGFVRLWVLNNVTIWYSLLSLSLLSSFSSLAFTVCEWRCLENTFTKDHWLSEWVNLWMIKVIKNNPRYTRFFNYI